MSIQTQITRILDSRNTIKEKLIDFGNLVETTAHLDDCAEAINAIENLGGVSISLKEGETYTIPAGYHNGSGVVSGVSGGGNYTLQSKLITPTKQQQSVTPDEGYYGLSDVTINAIPAAYQDVTSVTASASDVLANKLIVDASGTVTAGTMINNEAVSKTLDTLTTSYTIPVGYHNGNGIVNIELETQNVNPTTTSQDITPSTGKVLSKVIVAGVTTNGISAENIKHGTTINVGYTGTNNENKIATATGSYWNDGTTYTLNQVGTSIDMGAETAHRYITTDGLQVIPTTTYTASDAVINADITTYGKLTINAGDIIENPGSVANDLFTQGTISATAGWITSGTKINGASFANVATTGVTYKDISETTSAPILKSGDYLYINKGYTDNIKISLSKLVPDGGSVSLTGDYILNGYSAYDNDGVLIAGSMVDKGSTNYDFNALTETSITISAGYYNGSGKINLTDDLENALASI